MTGDRTPKLLETIDRVAKARLRRVPTGELNRFVEAVTQTHAPVSPGKKNVRVLYAAQTGVAPPTFVFFTNVATTFHFSYERFLANRLRESFGFDGTPIRLRSAGTAARRRRKTERERLVARQLLLRALRSAATRPAPCRRPRGRATRP